MLENVSVKWVFVSDLMFFFCRHHQHGRWQARIGRVAGNKDLYLGTFSKSKTYCLVWILIVVIMS